MEMMTLRTLGRVPRQVDGVWETIAARGADLCYLLPYGPDLNPIEHFFFVRKCSHEHDGCHERHAPERLVNATGEQLHDGGCGSSRPQLATLILSPVADKDSSEMQAIAAQDLTKVN